MKPLPLTNGHLFIDNSTLELLTTCPRSMEYAKLEKRIINAPSPALDFGSAIHLALEERYKNHIKPDEECYTAQAKVITDFFEANPPSNDEPRSANWALEVIKHYNQQYHTEPFNLLLDSEGKPLVELSFALPLFNYEPSKHIEEVTLTDVNHI